MVRFDPPPSPLRGRPGHGPVDTTQVKAYFHERDSYYMSRLWAKYPYRNPWAFVRDASICHEGRVKELIAIARRAFAWRVVQTNPKLDIDNIRKLTYAGQAKRRKLSLV